MRTGHYTSAIEEFVVVADVYQQLDKKLDYGSANRMIGEAYMQIREFDKALKYQQIHLGVNQMMFVVLLLFVFVRCCC